MRYLGIDYGTKRIGLALSDRLGMIAHPHGILPNVGNVVQHIVDLCVSESVEALVIGESVNMEGQANRLMDDINRFVEQLKQTIEIPIHFEKEWYSSVSAQSHLYGKGNIANPRWNEKQNEKRREPIDDNAAAIILQRFLEKQSHLKKG